MAVEMVPEFPITSSRVFLYDMTDGIYQTLWK